MIHVGLVGLGFMGMTHYLAYRKIRGVKVAAICEADARRRAGDWRTIKGNFGPAGALMDLGGIARYADFRQMLAEADLDMVDICLPTALHARMAVAALKAGKHVFCEKPIALTPADARKMVQAARRSGKLLQIGHVLPFFPEYKFAYQAITGGKYGKLLGGHFKRIISEPAWLPDFFDPRRFGGPMLDLHVHDAHFIRLVCGLPRMVQTVGKMRGEVLERFSTQFLFHDPDLCVTAASGVIAQQGRPFTHGYEIYLEGATLFFDYAALTAGGDLRTPLTVLGNRGKVLRPKLGSGDPSQAFVAELGEALRAVGSGTPSPLLDCRLACDAVLLCHRQTQSAERHRAVKV
jgi:predicted dehydrogenase